MEVSGQLHAPAASSLVTTGQEAGWAPELIYMEWQERKKSPITVPARN